MASFTGTVHLRPARVTACISGPTPPREGQPPCGRTSYPIRLPGERHLSVPLSVVPGQAPCEHPVQDLSGKSYSWGVSTRRGSGGTVPEACLASEGPAHLTAEMPQAGSPPADGALAPYPSYAWCAPVAVPVGESWLPAMPLICISLIT